MARIKVISECPFYDGMSVTFKAPCDCTVASGLKVHYEETSQTFDFVDAHGNNLAGLGNLFAKDAYVKVILNTGESKAYIQNADTNAYLERRLSEAGTGGGGGVSNVAYDATPLVTATATDPDGKTYTGATEYEVTIPAAEELFVGMQIVVVPTMKSATMKPFITVNGARGRIYTNAATTGSYFNGTRVDFIGADKPLALMYMGIVDEANNIGGWKCLNSVRVNVEALMSNGEAGVNKVPMSNGAGEKLVWRTHKDASLVGDATYKSSANRYDVTLPAIGNAATGDNGVYRGLEVTIIPDVTNKAKAKLAVNNYDGAASGSQIYLSTGDGTGGFVSVPANFLKAGMPVKMKYTGSGWRITDTPYSVFGKNGGTMSDEEGLFETTLSPLGIDIRDNDFRAGSELGAFSLDFTFSGDEGKEYGGGAINGLMYATQDHQAVPYGQMKAELDVVKTSVSEGKALIASAVTDKGVTTAGDATFAQIAENISLIEGGELAGDDDEIIVEDTLKESFIGVLDGTMANPVLPDGLTSIGSYAFYENHALVNPSLPNSVKSIGKYAFYNCRSLALTSLPSSVKNIYAYAFQRCIGLALVSLPSNLSQIHKYAFDGCTSLALTSLPYVDVIDDYAFRGCTNLRSITFIARPTILSSYAFSNCTNLTTINVPWAEGAFTNAPWGATNATINYNCVVEDDSTTAALGEGTLDNMVLE